MDHTGKMTEKKTVSYRPLILIVSGIFLAAIVVQLVTGSVTLMDTMRLFMAFFFLSFGAFKLVDLRGFVDMFAEYDVVTQNAKLWGYLYPFFELALGVAYLLNVDPISTNTATIVLMSISSLGVVRALRDRKKIRCACLGAVVQLPMSKVTLIEDVGMGSMAVVMLVATIL